MHINSSRAMLLIIALIVITFTAITCLARPPTSLVPRSPAAIVTPTPTPAPTDETAYAYTRAELGEAYRRIAAGLNNNANVFEVAAMSLDGTTAAGYRTAAKIFRAKAEAYEAAAILALAKKGTP